MIKAEKRIRAALVWRELHDTMVLDAADVVALLADHAEREAALRAEVEALRDVLLRHGFVPCDIPACNCGSWHPRFGYPERMREIGDALAEAGHPLSNGNGNKPLNALRELIAERDAMAKDAERYQWLRDNAYGLPPRPTPEEPHLVHTDRSEDWRSALDNAIDAAMATEDGE